MSASGSSQTIAASASRGTGFEAPPSSGRPSHRTSRSLIRGLALLREFTPEHPERGIAELATAMRVTRPTAHRYAATCLELGWLEQGRRRRYRLTRRCAGPGIAAMGTLRLSAPAEVVLRQLREETGRTVALAVLDGTEVLYLQRYRGFHRGEYQLARGMGAGSRRLGVDTAAGRALLAGTPELTVDDGDLPERARGLAIAVQGRCAIELTVPAGEMSAAELRAALGEPVWAAGTALEAALAGELAQEQERKAGLGGPR